MAFAGDRGFRGMAFYPAQNTSVQLPMSKLGHPYYGHIGTSSMNNDTIHFTTTLLEKRSFGGRYTPVNILQYIDPYRLLNII